MHLPVLASLRDKGEMVLVHVCDIQRERAANARQKFRFLHDSGDAVAALQRQDIDIVYAFGSAQMHFEYGLAALQSGKHLFVEKPIAASYAQAREIGQTARAHGLVAVGGHNRRFYRSLAAVQARAGKAGWRFAEAVFHKPEFGNPPLFGARTWLTANGIHALDALVFMMGGLPEHVTALAGEAGAAWPGAFSAVMRWRDGAQGVFLCNNNSGSRREEYVFHGLGVTCTVTGTGVMIEQDRAPSITITLDSTGDGVGAEHESFLRAIRTKTEPPHCIDALAPSLFLGELIEDGFSGRVQLPVAEVATLRQPRGTGGKAILVTHSAGLQAAVSRWLPRYQLVSLDDVRESASPRPEVVAAILGRGSPALGAQILDRLPGLRVVGIAGLSLSPFAPELLLARGIALVNASDAHAETVAEFALALAILGRRRAFVSHAAMRQGGWGTRLRTPGIMGFVERWARASRPAIKAIGLEPVLLGAWNAARPMTGVPAPRPAESRDLQGATVGLIGWGENARAFAIRLVAARARVLVYTEHATEADVVDAGATRASLTQVLAADIVSVHRGLNAATLHFLGAPQLAQLRPGSVLINVARAALIEPAALLERLKRGDVFACLDVFEDEPPAASHPLRRLSNVFLTSHIAGGSRDMQAAAAEEVVRKVAAHLSGDTSAAIAPQRLQTMT
jgi:phosphoglycerate dehydrogenase-like enzyme/predicted dehydrogenase